ncbi:MAG TPA: phage virion morphogenesis protein [Ignavibacteriaceae bacterium]|nr:phage virion morphogenesis protein [Ignavibacteriaceae bacterium]
MTDDSLHHINSVFQRLKEKGTPTLSLMQKIAGHLEENIHENLRSEGSGSPIPWARLSHSYAEKKAKNKSLVQKILTATGSMDQSIFQRVTDNEAVAGTNKIYAPAHQFSAIIHRSAMKSYITKKRSGKDAVKPKKNFMATIRIPARPFLYLTETFKDAIVRDVLDDFAQSWYD